MTAFGFVGSIRFFCFAGFLKIFPWFCEVLGDLLGLTILDLFFSRLLKEILARCKRDGSPATEILKSLLTGEFFREPFVV